VATSAGAGGYANEDPATNEARATRARTATTSASPPRPLPAQTAAGRLRASQLPLGAPSGGVLGHSATGMRPSRVPVRRVRVPAGPLIQRMCTECEDEEKKQVQAKRAPSQEAAWANAQREASPVLDVVGKGGGQPLTSQVRADMEVGLGADFSDVRIHTDAKAARSAAAVSAQAYTVGSEVVFGYGSFAPDDPGGRRTLAHELTHVLQQRSGPVPGTDTGTGVAVSDPSDSFEQEAEATASRILPGPQPVAGNGVPANGEAVRPSDHGGQAAASGQCQPRARHQIRVVERCAPPDGLCHNCN